MTHAIRTRVAKSKEVEAKAEEKVAKAAPKLDLSKVFKANPNRHPDTGQFVSGTPGAAQGQNDPGAVTGPRSGDNAGAPDNGTAPTPVADGPRSGDNKGTVGAGGAPSTSPPGGNVTGPRSGDNKAIPADGSPPGDPVTGPRSGDNKAIPADGSAPQGSVTGPRSGDNKGTAGADASGSVTTTSGTQSAAGAAQPANTAPAALMAGALSRGTRVVLKSGYEARLEDNKHGDTRLATVYGQRTQMGSVNVAEIAKAQVGGEWVPVVVGKKDTKRRLY